MKLLQYIRLGRAVHASYRRIQSQYAAGEKRHVEIWPRVDGRISDPATLADCFEELERMDGSNDKIVYPLDYMRPLA